MSKPVGDVFDDILKGDKPLFCHLKVPKNTNQPCHYYLIIPFDKESCIVATIVTSKVEKRLEFYRNKPNCKTFGILLKKGEFPFINVDSLLDTHSADVFDKKRFTIEIEECEVLEAPIGDSFISSVLVEIARSNVTDECIGLCQLYK